MSCCGSGACSVLGHGYDREGYCNGVDDVVDDGDDHGKHQKRDHHQALCNDGDDDRECHHRIIAVVLLCPGLEQNRLECS